VLVSLRSPHRWLLLLALLVLTVEPGGPQATPGSVARLPTLGAASIQDQDTEPRERAEAVDDLAWLLNRHNPPLGLPPDRSELLALKQRALADGDVPAIARVNAALSGEAFARAARVTDLWLDRRDKQTGLLPRSDEPDDQVWVYADTGADLFGHLALGTEFLLPRRLREVRDILRAERGLSRGLPDSVAVDDLQPLGLDQEARIFGAAEYAKDGLLPLLERLGPVPWRSRMRELVDAVLAEADTPTRFGPIPADSAEVNGDLLQVLARLSWAVDDPAYTTMARRITAAYLSVLPTTRYLPPHRWDFEANEPIERRRFRLSDHGNEILTGLLEWHFAESLRGGSLAAEQRPAIRRLLDTVLQRGRNDDGLWFRVLEIPSGRADQDGLTDNWGYLYQAYLTAAIVEDRVPDGEPARAARYRAEARRALEALPRYGYFDWQRGEMDGYADAVESALYLLRAIEVPEARVWVDRQVPVLYGFQGAEGRVSNGYLDGNYIRTALLYAFSLTGGASLTPWSESVLVGSAPDGACEVLSLSSASRWQGRLRFDLPRHRLHLELPVNYPRLNEWPEWFAVDPTGQYTLQDSIAPGTSTISGSTLAAGLELELSPGAPRELRVCPWGAR
jgi:hypothetical protein